MTHQIITPINAELVPDRIVREAERLQITSISRSQAFQLERRNQYPKRIRLSNRSVGWSYRALLDWISSRQTVETIQENK